MPADVAEPQTTLSHRRTVTCLPDVNCPSLVWIENSGGSGTVEERVDAVAVHERLRNLDVSLSNQALHCQRSTSAQTKEGEGMDALTDNETTSCESQLEVEGVMAREVLLGEKLFRLDVGWRRFHSGAMAQPEKSRR